MKDEAKKRKAQRDSLRKQFQENGKDSLSDHDLLEMLLSYCNPRQDTDALATQLLDFCGSFDNVCDLSVQSMNDFGLSFSTMTFLQLLPAFCSRYYTDISHQLMKETPLKGTETIGKYLFPYFIGKKEEHVLLLLLNDKDKALYCGFVSKGTLFSSDINFNGILQLAAKHRAYRVVMAHNHPSGIALPSKKDIDTTIRIQHALNIMHIKLKDHYIFGNNNFCAMSTVKTFQDIFT